MGDILEIRDSILKIVDTLDEEYSQKEREELDISYLRCEEEFLRELEETTNLDLLLTIIEEDKNNHRIPIDLIFRVYQRLIELKLYRESFIDFANYILLYDPDWKEEASTLIEFANSSEFEKAKVVANSIDYDKFGVIHAKILKVEPDTIDEFGKIYDYYVLIETKNKELVWIDDHSMLCDEQMEGQIAALAIDVWENFNRDNICKLENKEKKIIFREDSYLTEKGKKPVFYGEIVRKKQHSILKYCYLYLDVGSGIILIYTNKLTFKELNVGDYIKVSSFIIQLDAVNGRSI